MAINLENMSDIEIMAINKMYLEDKIKKLEQEISEKDKIINTFIETISTINKELFDLKQNQLFKEDFYLLCKKMDLAYDWESLQTDEVTIEMHLKYCESNNHRWCLIKDINNLPSKLESKGDK